MSNKLLRGFTIIELMLFLAITGLLIAGILVNASRSLDDQQYRDGVESIRNKISAQFAKVYSLTNDNTASDGTTQDPCESLKAVNSTGNTTIPRVSRGTSDCFYIGRFIEILPADNKSRLRITPVIAYSSESRQYYGDQTTKAGDILAQELAKGLSGYIVAKYSGNSSLVEDDQFDWGLAAVEPGTNTMKTIKLLVMRSPIDGALHTYNLLAEQPGTLDELALQSRLDDAYKATAEFCIADLTGGLDPPQRMSITIHKGATTPSDIETRLLKSEKDGGGAAC